MAKPGRWFVPLDVNWYDEWGYRVSNDAALLWVLMLVNAKRLKYADGIISRELVWRFAPRSMTRQSVDNAINELIASDVGAVGTDREGDETNIVLKGWRTWNEHGDDSSSGGTYGNHVRWHVNTQNPSSECAFCTPIAPDVAPNRCDAEGDVSVPMSPRIAKSKSKSKNNTTCSMFENEFEKLWEIYPRKQSKKIALAAYTARRNEGITEEDLEKATGHFVEQMLRERRDESKIMLGSTFYGPNERWQDYLTDSVEEAREPVAPGAGRMFANDAEWRASLKPDDEIIKLPGEQ